ncbi:hypothetical protein OESDEN_05683 [Oesophagostomum dentatum]|uniref:Trypsin Inhibitor like cysteine rich domain protein n=1 Tax=Oesophagostomum dentatum TaxID=61180 RepID=A0A0B1TAU0_OESDE|nr:hypothetical protein OESDEN_05683 [Oesophagostomum dentatum]
MLVFLLLAAPCKDNEVCSIRKQECGPFTCDTYQVKTCPCTVVLDPPQCLCAPGFVWLSENEKSKGCILATSCPMNITDSNVVLD